MFAERPMVFWGCAYATQYRTNRHEAIALCAYIYRHHVATPGPGWVTCSRHTTATEAVKHTSYSFCVKKMWPLANMETGSTPTVTVWSYAQITRLFLARAALGL